jgi:vancomycin resistance protein VanW
MSKRKLFCEISPVTYKISALKCRISRYLKDIIKGIKFARVKQNELLPVVIYSHKSLIRRRLGNVNMELQENKAVNLKIASAKVSHIVIKPGEVFSFWHLVGDCTEKEGYKKGLTISNGGTSSGIGGGMCQFTNLIHWIVLHTPMKIVEHHHHNGFDLFPDFNRQVPFGVGTSITYNYLDYRVKNNTDITFQIITYTTEEYLCGELRADKGLPFSYHIRVEDEYFSKEEDNYYRNNKIIREVVDKETGNVIERNLIMANHAKVMYDPKYIDGEIKLA